LDDTSLIRIQREAQAMGRLGSHPHIVTVFGQGEEQGQPYMVTELMGAVTLKDWLRRRITTVLSWSR